MSDNTDIEPTPIPGACGARRRPLRAVAAFAAAAVLAAGCGTDDRQASEAAVGIGTGQEAGSAADDGYDHDGGAAHYGAVPGSGHDPSVRAALSGEDTAGQDAGGGQGAGSAAPVALDDGAGEPSGLQSLVSAAEVEAAWLAAAASRSAGEDEEESAGALGGQPGGPAAAAPRAASGAGAQPEQRTPATTQAAPDDDFMAQLKRRGLLPTRAEIRSWGAGDAECRQSGELRVASEIAKDRSAWCWFNLSDLPAGWWFDGTRRGYPPSKSFWVDKLGDKWPDTWEVRFLPDRPSGTPPPGYEDTLCFEHGESRRATSYWMGQQEQAWRDSGRATAEINRTVDEINRWRGERDRLSYFLRRLHLWEGTEAELHAELDAAVAELESAEAEDAELRAEDAKLRTEKAEAESRLQDCSGFLAWVHDVPSCRDWARGWTRSGLES